MDTINIVNMFNNEGLNLKEIGEKVGISKSTVQRRLVADGWQYNKKTSKYEKNVSRETINNESNTENEASNILNNETTNIVNNETSETSNTANNVSRETSNIANNETINIVNRTYGIPEDIDRALKIKCAIEGKKAIDIVREALKNAIEPKYFDLK